jgi:hypothetical protein
VLFDFGIPTVDEIAVLDGAPLRVAYEGGIAAVVAATGVQEKWVRSRVLKAVGVKDVLKADTEDGRECLRVLRSWATEPSTCQPPGPRPKVRRPSGAGQLPVPRIVKWAAAGGECGLCGDAVKAGELIGRPRPPKQQPFVAMGWLCGHCLYERRAAPRRRDVLLRVFHRLFAGEAVDFNAFECGVLLSWLTSDPALARSAAWRRDPLESTLERLRTGIAEEAGAVWVSVRTAHTIMAVLQEPAAAESASPDDLDMLLALAFHLREWQANPSGVERWRFGTGPRYRREVLARTSRPSVLSSQGGPFDVHTALPVIEEDETEGAEERPA